MENNKILELMENMHREIQNMHGEMQNINNELQNINMRVASIENVMATKEDLTTMATKKDLATMATKEDVAAIAYIKQAVMETSEDVKQILDDQKSIYEIIGEHEITIRSLRRRPV